MWNRRTQGEKMENSSRFFENRDCRYFPCHKGTPEFREKNGKIIKVCTNCNYPHRPEHYDNIIEILKNR